MSAPTQRPNVTPERLMQLAWGHTGPLMIEAAIKLRVFDVLDGGEKTAEQVATAAGASQRGIRMLLDGLVALQLLSKSNGRYKLTEESSTFLVSTKPNYRGAFFRHISDQLVPSWLKLTEIVRTGRPATPVNQETSGAAFFAEFVEDIFPMRYPVAQMLGDHLGLAQASQPVSVLDLAAGSGVWGIALAKKSPQVRVTAVDWPEVLKVTKRVAERHGVADRFTFAEGDLLKSNFGSGHQVATLGHIIHSEGEARSRALLKKVFAALAPGGTIVIAEWLPDEERSGPPGALIFAVNMLVNTEHGDTYTFGELSRWLTEAGFTNARTLESPGPSPLVLATKPAR
jgi:3-hydroxy-5-methyl-1-naphthoate 3-O-methyltransferase